MNINCSSVYYNFTLSSSVASFIIQNDTLFDWYMLTQANATDITWIGSNVISLEVMNPHGRFILYHEILKDAITKFVNNFEDVLELYKEKS